jgi:hypothetical protein
MSSWSFDLLVIWPLIIIQSIYLSFAMPLINFLHWNFFCWKLINLFFSLLICASMVYFSPSFTLLWVFTYIWVTCRKCIIRSCYFILFSLTILASLYIYCTYLIYYWLIRLTSTYYFLFFYFLCLYLNISYIISSLMHYSLFVFLAELGLNSGPQTC